jgi:hypothetical protein
LGWSLKLVVFFLKTVDKRTAGTAVAATGTVGDPLPTQGASRDMREGGRFTIWRGGGEGRIFSFHGEKAELTSVKGGEEGMVREKKSECNFSEVLSAYL